MVVQLRIGALGHASPAVCSWVDAVELPYFGDASLEWFEVLIGVFVVGEPIAPLLVGGDDDKFRCNRLRGTFDLDLYWLSFADLERCL